MEEIQHFTHSQHPLFLKDDERTTVKPYITCGICRRRNIEPPFYVCDSCQYYLHKSCANLNCPQTLHHSFHPSHGPLTLRTHQKYDCDSCHRLFKNAPCFGCLKCDFKMDVECALMPPITFPEVDPKNIIQHFSHQHPMPLVEVDNKDEINCFGCHESTGDRVYGCTKCNYFLHESCAELPKERQYHFHLDHGLLDLRVNHAGFRCTLCNKDYYGNRFALCCRRCRLKSCVKCLKSSRSPTRGTFKYEYHEHLLCFQENRNGMPISQCSNYDSYCKQPATSYSQELRNTSPYAFYCLECDFKVHLLCGPLPSMIKHECHDHPLSLVDSRNQNNSGEYCCDICKTERDPRIRVYYCTQCKYAAHVHCVAAMEIILKIVKGELKDVKLKNVGDDFWKTDDNDDDQPPIDPSSSSSSSSLFTLKDLLNSLSPYEKGWLKRRYRWNDDEDASTSYKGEAEESNKLGDADYDDHILPILQLSRFTDQDFEKIFDEFYEFYRNKKVELKSRDLGLKIVTSVKGYKIPLLFQPLLIKLIDKYGDVSGNWFETIEGKSMVYFLLCKVVKEMCSTQVGDITRNLLQQWYFHLRFVRDWGEFKIDFAKAHLERLVRAFLGHQAKRLQYEIPTRINEKIAKLQQGLKKCEEYHGSSAKSEFMKKCLKEDSELQWKNACEGLLSDPKDQGPKPDNRLW